jgi:integrase
MSADHRIGEKMASIIDYDGGLKRIEFSLTPKGARRIVRLGRVNKKTAQTWLDKIESIIGDKLANRPHDAEVSNWLGGLDEAMLARLRVAGLAEGVGLTQRTLGAFMDQFFANLTGKPATRIAYGNVRRNLEDYFGAGKFITGITAADADGWRRWMVEHEETAEDGTVSTKWLSIPTISRRVIAARTMFRAAIRWKLLQENAFDGVKTGQQTNDKRKAFVSRADVDAVIEQATDAEWKLIIALSRYAGLRCPSEHYALRWGDVDWERSRLTVHSPKTEHHEAQATRTVPIFAEVRPYLLTAFEQAEPGTEYVISKHRLGCLNLRQQFQRLIKRAGVAQWPKLFHNLRASRETELMREYDLATVCKWIGNSPAVAAKHYAMSVDLNADFAKAVGPVGNAQQKAQQTAVSGDSLALTSPLPDNEETPENRGSVACYQSSATADNTGVWAIQGSNL